MPPADAAAVSMWPKPDMHGHNRFRFEHAKHYGPEVHSKPKKEKQEEKQEEKQKEKHVERNLVEERA